jgi:hypothetical protein
MSFTNTVDIAVCSSLGSDFAKALASIMSSLCNAYNITQSTPHTQFKHHITQLKYQFTQNNGSKTRKQWSSFSREFCDELSKLKLLSIQLEIYFRNYEMCLIAVDQLVDERERKNQRISIIML